MFLDPDPTTLSSARRVEIIPILAARRYKYLPGSDRYLPSLSWRNDVPGTEVNELTSSTFRLKFIGISVKQCVVEAAQVESGQKKN